MSPIFSGSLRHFGLHSNFTKSPIPEHMFEDDGQFMSERTFINITNIAECIPGIAQVSAIIKFVQAQSQKSKVAKSGLENYIVEAVEEYETSKQIRAVLAFFCLGPILFILDLIVTIGRMCESSKYQHGSY